MIDRIIGWSIRNRILVVLATLVMAIGGASAAWIAPVDAIPDLSENQVIVHAEWADHGPVEVESQITAPLSLELNGVRGVKVIRSSSDLGASTLWVIFDDSVDVPSARRSLSERLSAFDTEGRFPSGVTPRLAPDGAATGQIFWYTVEGPGHDLGRLRAIQDWYVKPQLAAVPGVAEVASVGGMAPEFQVEADPTRLRLHGVALDDLIAAVSASNGSGGGGVLHKGNAEFVVRGRNGMGDRDGSFRPDAAIEDLRRVVVPTIAGRTVLLADVAAVALGPQPRRGALEKDGVEVVGGVILMANGENPLALTRRIKARIRAIAAGLPRGMQIVPMYDRTPLILGAVETVSATILEAMVTASLCVLILLKHARAALVVSLTLPLSVLASFGLLEGLRRLGIIDVPINAMSLAGLAISIGVIVDSAIVMTENVLHALHLRFGDDRVTGDVSGLVATACRQVGRPIVFSILIMLL
ncbi:MAG: efflux RND transporter permease subunit, partial [Singulisphaera sp.]